MKSLIKRAIIGFIVLVIVLAIFYITVNFFRKREYKYIDRNDESGISNKCYLDKDQFAICKINEELVIVRQFYEI